MFNLAKKLIILEDFTRFDKSKIWNIHTDYFQNVGIKAWTKGEIPYSGISNYNEAYKKARLFIENLKVIWASYFDDLEKNPNSKEPPTKIKILEIGGGYGEFAKNFLEAFRDICEHEGLDYFENLEYSFTDFSAKTVEEVKKIGKLKEFETKVRFERLDAMKLPEFLTEDEKLNGYYDLVMANYLLDQLPARVIARVNNNFKEKYIRLEDFEDRVLNPKKPKGWVKKIKKKLEFRDIDLEMDPHISTKEFEILRTCFRPGRDSTIVYSYGALAAVKNFMKLIHKNGLIICSDFNAASKPGLDSYEPCYYGNSIAQAVNYDFIFKYFSDTEQKIMLYEDPIRPLHTLVLTHKDFPFALQLGQKYDLVYKQNLLVRIIYVYLVELKYGLWIFIILLFLYLFKWIIFDLFPLSQI